MTIHSNIEAKNLAEIPLFKDLDAADLARLAAAGHVKTHAAGEYFFMQGDQTEALFVLTQGRVRLSQSGADGHQVLIRIILPITLFGLITLAKAKTYPVSAQALADSRAVYWLKDEMMAFMNQMPKLGLNAIQIMSSTIQEMQERFRQVATERVERRLARTLLRLIDQAGRKVSDGILIDLPITRQELAEMCGTTLFSVSRILNQWEDQSLVSVGRERVIIRDPSGLEKIVGDLL